MPHQFPREASIASSLGFIAMLVRTENSRSFYATCIANFFVRMEWGIATGLLPIQVYELGGSPVEIGLVYTVFSSIQVISPLIWGALSDSSGRRKRFISLGMLGLPPIYVLIANQTTVLPLILLRGTTAIFKGAVVTCSWALVADLSPSDTIGRNMGVLSFAELAGFGVGPVVGGLITDKYGFSILWYSVALLCLIGGLAISVWGQDSTKVNLGNRGLSRSLGIWEKSLVVKMSALSVSYAVLLLGYSFLGPNLNVYFTRDLDYNKTTIGLISLAGTGIATFLQPILGYATDRWSRRLVMFVGCASLSSGHLLLLVSGQIQWVILSQTLIQCHNAFHVAAAAHVTATVAAAQKSRALGTMDSIGNIARAVSATAGGFLIAGTSVQTALKVAAVFPVITMSMVFFVVKDLERRKVVKE